MPDGSFGKTPISLQALKRMPFYLQHLKKLRAEGVEIIAAPAIAESLSLNEVQVRKDLAAVSPTKGKPKAGFSVSELIAAMEDFLGYRNVRDAVIVGAGSLGRALISYSGFDNYGIRIVAGFDRDVETAGGTVAGKPIFPSDQMSEICRRLKVRIGIITVPADSAQVVCDQLVAGGVKAIWNFAPTHLFAPKEILIQNENMAASLAILSKHLEEKMNS
jgi:redox-sensing transcriptional repressor